MNGFIKKEELNFIKRSSNPVLFVRTAVHGFGILARGFLKKRASIKAYPQYLEGIFSKDRAELKKEDIGFLSEIAASSKEIDETGLKKIYPVNVNLATQGIELTGFPDWKRVFNDEEDIYSLHRWGWLLEYAVKNPSQEVKDWGTLCMQNWFMAMGDNARHPGWESYSISERITNCILFFLYLKDYDNDDVRVKSIEKGVIGQAETLRSKLEFRGKLTNNHVLNNARALYLLGRLSAREDLADIGRLIFIHETPHMFTKHGFLNEGSSNYHLLLLRTYLEVLWMAEFSNDSLFHDSLKPVISKMVEAAWFMNVYDNIGGWKIPLIGDVTPDFRPEWLKAIHLSRLAVRINTHYRDELDTMTGWNALAEKLNSYVMAAGKSAKTPYIKKAAHNTVNVRQFQNYHEWYRIDFADWTLISYVYPDGAEPLTSHGHNSVLSFVLYWKGVELIIDPGRFNYKKSDIGIYGRRAVSHNTFLVNGFEPYPLSREIYPQWYKRGRSEVEYEDRERMFMFKITHTGFTRLTASFIASREFLIKKNEIIINDFIEGIGSNRVKTYFHFSPLVNIKDLGQSGLDLRLKDALIHFGYKADTKVVKKNIVRGKLRGVPAGLYFPRYGKSETVDTLILDCRARFPYKGEYRISL